MSIALHASLFLLPFLLIASDSGTPAIGKPAPPVTAKQVAEFENVPAWQSLRGAPVVLEFWATWCAPCVNAIPHWNELASKFKNVRFISITDDGPDVVKKFLAEHPIEGVIAFDYDGATHSAYGVTSYPKTVLVDANGIMRGIVSPAQLTEALLQELAAGRAIDLQPPTGPACSSELVSPLSEAKSGGTSSVDAGPGRWRARNVPLKTILAAAYSMPETSIVVPDAVAALRYNVMVRRRPPAGDALQTIRLNVERVVKMHRETRKTDEASVEVLVVDSVASR